VKKRLVSVGALAIFLAVVVLAATVRSQMLNNQGPTAYFTYSPIAPMPGETINFDASSSYDPDGTIITYTWDFGDGTIVTSSSPFMTHSYLIDGTYTVQLTVADNNGVNNTATAVIDVSTITFFRVVFGGTLIPLSNVKVTAYGKILGNWVPIPAGPSIFEVKYDNMTQPDLAKTRGERYRNPGFTASILRDAASNIGFDVHPGCMNVFFKFEWGSYVAYWPNETTRVYSYKHGVVETHDYLPCHQAVWDSSASTYVIRVNDIPGHGVSPTESHPIIVGIFCPPPSQQYSLTVGTNPPGITTIPGQGSYNEGTNVVLTAPTYVNTSPNARYRFNYWDVDGNSQGFGVNPITVSMYSNHTASAHYIQQYSVVFNQNGLSGDSTGTVVTSNATAKSFGDLPFTYWVDSGNSVTYSYNSIVSTTVTGKQYRMNSVTGPSSPIVVTSPATISASYVTQYLVTFAQTGLDSTATGTVVTVNGTAKTYSQLSFNWWVDSSSMVTYFYNPTVASTDTGKQFKLTGIHCPTSPFVVTGPVTITGSYCIQYKVTFTHTGLDATASGTVVTVKGNPKAYSDLPYIAWFDSGTSITYSYTDPVLSATSGKRFRLISTTGPGSPFTVSGSVTVTGNYKIQYRVTFDQTGVGAAYSGTVVNVDAANYNVASLPVSFWWDQSSTHSFSFFSPLVVNASMQYSWTSTSGLSSLQSGTLTASASGSIVGNYAVANCITFDQTGVNPDYTGTVVEVDGTPYGLGALPVSFTWQIGSVHSFTFHSPLVASVNVKQYVWTSTSGLSTLQSGSITVAAYGSIVGNYKTQYYLNLATSPPGVGSPSAVGWYDSGTYAAISTPETVDIVPGASRYKFSNWTTVDMSEIVNASAPATTVLMDTGKTVTANYTIQYKITFSQSGVGSFLGAVVNVDGTDYFVGTLPVSYWWDAGSSHLFTFQSPLVITTSLQYVWASTSGLTTLQTGTLTISGSGTVTGNYSPQTSFQVTFDQTGVAADFNDTVVTIDGVDYNVMQLPVSFWWSTGSSHTFSFASPLTVNAEKRYVWTTTTGLSSLQTGSISASSTGSVIGNYKTQYYVSLATDPPGVASPSGAGWYDVNTNATVTTPGFIDIVPGSSRYRFNGWETANISEIADPSRSPTTVVVDEGKTVIATYVVQYVVTFDETGVGSDFTGSILTVDGIDYNLTQMPVSFHWDNGTTHNFDFKSYLLVTPNAKRYVWDTTTGISTSQSDSIVITNFGTITGNYKIQYYLTVATNPPGIATIPGEGWYNTSSSAALNAPTLTNYTFNYWIVNGVPQGAGVQSITLTMNSPNNAQAYYSTISPYTLTVTTTLGGTTNPSPGVYSYSAGQMVQVTAIPNSGYVLNHWELDGTNVSSSNNPYTVTMNADHTLKAVFSSTPPPPSVSIDPMTATVTLGQSVSFTSMVSGGTQPYSYQWYLNGAPVPGATSNTWSFTPPASNAYFVYLKVTDANSNTVVSDTAEITVVSTAVGGYSVPLHRQTPASYIAAYMILIGLFSTVLVTVKRKRK
jgi:hypothetical protein